MPDPVKERRFKAFRIPNDSASNVWINLLVGNLRIRLPDDAVAVRAWHDPACDTLNVIIASADYQPIAPGCAPEVMRVEMERLDLPAVLRRAVRDVHEVMA